MADDMFSNIPNLYTVRPREAERSDARLDIRRHDPDQEKRKGHDHEKESGPLFNEDDDAVVSIEALRVFLKTFLGSLEDKAAAQSFSRPQENPDVADDKPAQGNAMMAASAYAHASETKAHGRTPETSTPAPAQTAKLPAEEIRIIHRLLENLQALSGRGVESLRIDRGESFLLSLVAASEKALNP